MSQVIGEIEIESDQACVVYDAKTGRIEHLHRVITLRGGTNPERSEIETRTMELAGQNGKKTSRLRTLIVSPEQFRPGREHKVDLETGSIISKQLKNHRKHLPLPQAPEG
jgi:hypothetical protein